MSLTIMDQYWDEQLRYIGKPIMDNNDESEQVEVMFSRGKIYTRPINAKPGTPFTELGRASAIRVKEKNGNIRYYGQPEAVYELRLSDEDKKMLHELGIGNDIRENTNKDRLEQS